MKLNIWKLPELPSQTGFFIDLIEQKSLSVKIHLHLTSDPSFRIEFHFPNHFGALATEEFAMDSYLESNSESGGNFFLASDSEFLAFCKSGSLSSDSWNDPKSYIFTDTDQWVEILSSKPPSLKKCG